MTVTRRGAARGLRSAVLVVALIAPAILASGMLMADFTGYGERARSDSASDAAVRAEPAGTAREGRAGAPAATAGDRVPAGMPGARPTVPPAGDAPEAWRIAVVPMAGAVREPLLDPTPVPEPTGPARLYEGIVRILPIVRPVREVVHRDAPEVRRPAEAKPEPREETTFRCAPEWRDTWLWELCREQEAHPEGGR
ncbi:hypothetical protein [Microbispora sp. H10836]|uniref:hypothetical protein n=1 Tax=Microbispora sp. H10836 TaxID=2729106 RepID=UPI001474D1F0|nr:hypothetical protein [Microbispora sp. H10836]